MIRSRILAWAKNRKPDFIIGGSVVGGKDTPYLKRHYLIPKNPLFNIYVHQFLRSDDDRALHGHPWLFNVSWLLEGEYIEWTPADDEHLMPDVLVRCEYPEKRRYKTGSVRFRWGAAPHRIELCRAGMAIGDVVMAFGKPIPCWSLFITGPRVREWGFYCVKKGWVHWRKFTAPSDSGLVGKGCDA